MSDDFYNCFVCNSCTWYDEIKKCNKCSNYICKYCNEIYKEILIKKRHNNYNYCIFCEDDICAYVDVFELEDKNLIKKIEKVIALNNKYNKIKIELDKLNYERFKILKDD